MVELTLGISGEKRSTIQEVEMRQLIIYIESTIKLGTYLSKQKNKFYRINALNLK